MTRDARTRRLPVCVLVLVHAIFLFALLFFWTHARYEDRLFERLVRTTVAPTMSEQERAEALLHRIHALLAIREEVWGAWEGEPPPRPPLGTLRRSALHALMEGGGCGAFSLALARALEAAGIVVRIGQMKVGDDVFGRHIFVTARVEGRWVVLDPLLDTAYRKPEGTLASVEELRENWDAYRSQGPEWSNPAADFAAVRYTNWDKVPVVMPALRSVLELIRGREAVEQICLASYVLNVDEAVGLGTLALYLPVLGLTVALAARARS